MKKLLLPILKGLLDEQKYNMVRHLSWGVIDAGLVIAAIGLPGLIDGPVPYVPILTNLYRGLASELVGIGFTIAIIDSLIRWNALKEEKRRLIRQMGSRVHSEAIRAAEEIWSAGWLADGSLRGAWLAGANLQGANLVFANLQGASLAQANLQEVGLLGANLEGADLVKANLRGAWHVYQGQLRKALTLYGATMPDGTKLPDNDTWHETFEAWCETAEMDEHGFIIPAKISDGDGD